MCYARRRARAWLINHDQSELFRCLSNGITRRAEQLARVMFPSLTNRQTGPLESHTHKLTQVDRCTNYRMYPH